MGDRFSKFNPGGHGIDPFAYGAAVERERAARLERREPDLAPGAAERVAAFNRELARRRALLKGQALKFTCSARRCFAASPSELAKFCSHGGAQEVV